MQEFNTTEKEHLKGLPENHKKFVQQYAYHLNGAKAYSVTFPNASPDTCKSAAWKLLHDPVVKEAVEKEIIFHTRSKNETLARIDTIANFDLSPYIDKKNQLDMEKLSSDGFGWLVKGFRKTKFGYQVILRDFDKHLEMLAKIQGLFNDNIVTVNINNELSAKEQLTSKLNQLKEKLNVENDST